MVPAGALPAGTTALCYELLETPIGELVIVADRRAMLVADFTDCFDRLGRLLLRYYRVRWCDVRPAPQATGYALALDAYFAGQLDAIDPISIGDAGTLFQRSVWQALRCVEPGARTSYGQLAQIIGHPSARAVGFANASNPVSVVIPCHRLTGAGAKLTGYAGGLDRKAWLLAHEAGATPPPLRARREPRFPARPI